MKTIYMFLIALMFTVVVTAQQAINYKALIKDNMGNVLVSQPVTIQFAIIQETGNTTVYQEEHNTTTDANGIVIVNIGMGTVLSGNYNTIDWANDSHFLNVQIDSGSGLVDLGTTQFMAVPYALYAENSGSSSTGLEALDEGNGDGWRFIGANPINYGNIGLQAVDLSYSGIASGTNGATGSFSLASGAFTTASGLNASALGNATIASGDNATAMGWQSQAVGSTSTSMGYRSVASGDNAFAFGQDTEASGFRSAAGGYFTESTGNHTFAIGDHTRATASNSAAFGFYTLANQNDALVVGRYNASQGGILFQVGNGTSNVLLSNALNVYSSGVVTAPSLTIGQILLSNPQTLVTREFVETTFIEAGSSDAPSGLEAIDEGNGIGWRLRGRNPNDYGNIGEDAIDFSVGSSLVPSGALGDHAFSMGTWTYSLGEYSFSFGFQSSATNDYSLAFGYSADATGINAVAIGYGTRASSYATVALGDNTEASGFSATALGSETIADDQFSTVVGRLNDNTLSTTSLFQVGNGDPVARSNAFTVFANGDATLAGTLTQSSDRRLKQDINKLNYGLNEVLQLNPVSYHWKKHPDQPKSLGLIAQDVQTIIKEIVHEAENEDKTLSVSYVELIPVLIKAIQEQQDIIDNQRQTIKNQEQANTNQSQMLQALLERVEALENQKSTTTVKLECYEN
ncbi:tail fiber domain-containing protein [Psychroserpens sp. XS_ASV72]|uniref:tail fiber domain-containing protein n=1 Tax=Psychroserpens sp. XS_ASV72 TaxID=3241293 RepID=UPI00351732FB